MSGNRRQVLLRALHCGQCLQSKKGPGTPSATRAATRHKHGVSEAFLNCSHEGSDLYQAHQALCRRAGSIRNRGNLGGEPPNLIIGGKAPKM
jgi:hypothetical protein